jgi:hypothetical protein
MCRYATVLCLSLAAMSLCLAWSATADAYEPIYGPDVVYYTIRATKPQRDRLWWLAYRDGIDLNAVVQQQYGAAGVKYLTMAQAAQLIHDLEYRGQYDISRPYKLRDWAGALQDRTYGAMFWPVFRFFRL